jgi:hypothetical protein
MPSWRTAERLYRELAARLRVPQNAVSYHLKHLRELGLPRDRHSHADARDVYYYLDLDRLRTFYQQAGQALHPVLSPEARGASGTEGIPDDRPIRVLFLCTHNCPVFPDPVRIHWSFPDPAAIEDEAARSRAFSTLWLELNTRIGHLLNLRSHW